MGITYGNFNSKLGAQTDSGRQKVNDFCIVKNGLLIHLDGGDSRSFANTGTIWTDLSPSANNGTLTNGPTYDSGNGGSIVFDGSNDYVTLPISSLNLGTGTFSLEAWVYPASLSGIDIIYLSASSNDPNSIQIGHYGPGYGGYGTGFFLGDYNGITRKITSVGSFATINTWYHFVGLRNAANEYVVYINTVPTTTNAVSTLDIKSNNPWLGRNPDGLGAGEIWHGKIANFRVYNRELSLAEIKQNFNAYKWRFGL